jgi:hypothetical protein
LYAKVQENITKSYDYLYTQHEPKKAAALIDETLEMISDLKIGKEGGIEPVQLLYNLYYAKAASFLLIGQGRITALDYYKKALEVVEQWGDMNWLAGEYRNYASHLSNAKQDKSLQLEYHKKAIETAKKCDDEILYIDCLASYAGDMTEVRDSDRGLPQFEEVLKYKDTLLRGSANTKQIYLVAYGLYQALSAVKAKGHLHDVDYTVTAVIKTFENGNMSGGKYSFCTDNTPDRFMSVFEDIPDGICEGFKKEWESNSYFTHNIVKTTQEVVSMDAEISVQGETYKNCIHIRETDIISEDENDTSGAAEIVRLLNGVKNIWYAPNAGIVKYTFVPVKGENISIELSEYKINNPGETELKKKYLPIALGNAWRYKSIVASDEYEYDNLFETLYEENGNHYTSYWAYAYKK